MPGFQKWQGCSGDQCGEATNSPVPTTAWSAAPLPTDNFPCFLRGLHSVLPFSEAKGNERYLGQCIEVSFSPHLQAHLFTYLLMCLFLQVLLCLLPLWLQLFFKCIWAQVPWAPWLEIFMWGWAVSVSVRDGYNQYWAEHHSCPHRWTLQPLPIQNSAVFPYKSSSKKPITNK